MVNRGILLAQCRLLAGFLSARCVPTASLAQHSRIVRSVPAVITTNRPKRQFDPGVGVHLIIGVMIPALVIFMMAVVGTQLQADDFRRVQRQPWLVALGTLAPFALLPPIAAALIYLVRPEPAIAVGMLLIAACPVAGLASFYSLLGRGDVALAVTLTAMSSVAALVATPIALTLSFEWLLTDAIDVDVPLLPTIKQLLIGLVMPVAAGMAIRARWPNWVARRYNGLQRLGLLALAALVMIILVNDVRLITENLFSLVAATVLYTVCTAALGLALGFLFGLPARERITTWLVFTTRNLTVALLIATSVLGRIDFAAFGAVFLVVQVLLLMPLLLAVRRRAALTPLAKAL